ncbi:MAG: asparagine synthase, partial [Nitrosomonas sp.]|nr:asparagine synthase [Nitrosomonas sp.]
MSGLCGWFGYSATNADNRQLIEKMAEPIVRFDSSKVLTMTKSMAAIGIAADDRYVHSYQNNGVVAALWGQVRYQGKPSRDFDRIGGIAKVLADGCQSKGGNIFVDLEGEFTFCMLNEDTGLAILAVD